MSPKLDGENPRRVDVYIRVSRVAGREGDTFISPKVQEERCRAWATSKGHEVVAVHPETDKSGGTMNRPMLNEVMRRIESGETDGIVVYNLSRFARTLVGSVELIRRINERGALFASVQDSFDITTTNGRMVMNILLAISTAERERHQEQWLVARSEAIGRGIHLYGRRPVAGYRVSADRPVNPRTGRPVPAPLEKDPEIAPVIVEVFRRRAAGETWSAICDFLNAEAVPTESGRPWSISSTKKIVSRRVYLGVAYGDGGDGKAGAHDALIDEATWHAAQQRRSMRADRGESPALLRGLVRCAGCRYTMAARPTTRKGKKLKKFPIFSCARGIEGCPAPVTIHAIGESGGDALDAVVIHMMWEELYRIEFQAADSDKLAELQEAADAAAFEFERAATDTELEQALGRSMMLKRLEALRADATAQREALDEALAAAGRAGGGLTVAELQEKWDSGEMSMSDKRDLLARTIRAIFVRPPAKNFRPVNGSRGDHFGSRIHVVWMGDPEVDGPRQGRLGYVSTPFVFPDAATT